MSAIRRPGDVMASDASFPTGTQRRRESARAAVATRRSTTAHSIRWCVTP